MTADRLLERTVTAVRPAVIAARRAGERACAAIHSRTSEWAPSSPTDTTERTVDAKLRRMNEPNRHTEEESIESADPRAIYDELSAEVERVLVGNERAVTLLTIAVLTRGHVLLEGVPGVAKTTIATLFARATGLDHHRVQMTPDILPADITGTHIYDEREGTFELHRGPVFANLVVADEINRATPKTQSALLEAMQERQVSIEGETLALPTPFVVVATQNPIEMEGVFELPEAQRDRFQFKLTVDLPDRTNERELFDRFDDEPELGPAAVEQVVGVPELLAAREAVSDVHVSPAIREYVLDLVATSREHPDVIHGASPRATLTFLNGSKARAAIDGRAYVIPDDVKALAEPTLVHRLILSADAELSDVRAGDVVREIVEDVEPPGADVDVSATRGPPDSEGAPGSKAE